ncbi:MAG: hypothetical protein A2087_06705 [Spirochaetes bacterium GWD1_61_31]|nr:MAG: hypothetical protein A2Y37_08765 [Spirochaetes bacterium GWB1_60_80]OHD31863.1 MAG: hypothetical protein A2004_10150 [Spirochaetes bacterium GWC1_61_12]OHD40040.1 MAG: hypothetical protein A2087_06705 [Spirochaetes bacterium GWD1_61_31]OHD42306.1 MAG: hypothetical protein A2Y35_11295 [Spirochaetes bacterium GWE1_60_18]OHD58454.1 MAG: hypothetical protein A2Y32_06790 [Spirochaetes bacterium GWF1_60_12]HAP43994.1 hypothetical protein [Spirochaetaceae bacterium]
MALTVPEVRPALISDQALVEQIDELRRFRHLFRNLYKTRIHPAKLKIVNTAACEIEKDFMRMHESFAAWLRELQQNL